MTDAWTTALRDPVDGSSVVSLTTNTVRFAGGREYRCVDRRPILIDEASSLFSVADAAAKVPTTQDRDYRDRRNLKNYVRQRILPSLTWDPLRSARHQNLAARAAGRPVLILGAGDRVEQYRSYFPDSTVVASDVHLQFDADCVIDAHRIPFRDRYFGLVLAAQVLEHTSRPWLVTSEMQRVADVGACIHIDVPFTFPYHGAPYDFFRFTPTALRFLFDRSHVLDLGVTEGRFSAAAVSLASGVVDSFGGRRSRQAALAAARLSLWWLRYLDAFGSRRDRFNSPKGLFVTVEVDGRQRQDREMLDDVKMLLA
jgi:hypothetical protein